MAAAFGSWGFLTRGEEAFDPASGHLAAIGRKVDDELVALYHRAALLHHHIAVDRQGVGLDVDERLVAGDLLGAGGDDDAAGGLEIGDVVAAGALGLAFLVRSAAAIVDDELAALQRDAAPRGIDVAGEDRLALLVEDLHVVGLDIDLLALTGCLRDGCGIYGLGHRIAGVGGQEHGE